MTASTLTGFAALAAVLLVTVHRTAFHRPGTAHARWWQARPSWQRRASDGAAGAVIGTALALVLAHADAAAAVLLAAGDTAYAALMIIRWRPARVVPLPPGREADWAAYTRDELAGRPRPDYPPAGYARYRDHQGDHDEDTG